MPLPSPRLAIAQLVLSCAEWILFASVLYVLLPPSELSFLTFLGAFLASILLGLVSHVPAGLGVFEGMMVLLLHPYLGSQQLIPAFVVFRAVYYLCPFVLALVLLRRRRAWTADFQRCARRRGPWTIDRATDPESLSALTFLAGAVLLISGAIPASPSRLQWLERLFPLAVVETSHFLGSIASALLLILSRGCPVDSMQPTTRPSSRLLPALPRRFCEASTSFRRCFCSACCSCCGGPDRAFYRRAAFFDTRFSPDWIAAMVGASVRPSGSDGLPIGM